MAIKILLNTTRLGSTVCNAGSSFDTVTEAATIATLEGSGGRLVDPTPAVVAAAAIAVERRKRGDDVSSIDAGMIAEAGGGEDAGGGAINWRPDGTGDAATWLEVMAFIAGAGYGEATILASQFGGAYSIPPGTYDLKGATFEGVLGNASGNVIDVADGAVLHDCLGARGGVALALHGTSGPALTFTQPGGGSPAAFALEKGAIVANFGTAPAIVVPDATPFVVAGIYGGSFGAQGGPPQGPLVRAGIGSVIIGACIAGSTWTDGWLVNDGVDPTAALAMQHDGTFKLPAMMGFAGQVFNVAWGYNGGGGPTAFRPAPFFGPVPVGCIYSDTDLGAVVQWTGAAWVAIGGGAPPVFPADRVVWVSCDNPAAGDGSFGNPYKTIQDAVNAIPAGVDSATARRVWSVLIAPGTYDEDVTIDGTNRRIALVGLGPWNLGLFNGVNWAASNARNITWNVGANNIDSIRHTLMIGTVFAFGEGLTTHPAYNTGARISGQILVNDTVPGGTTKELYLQTQVHDFAAVGRSLDFASGTGMLHLYLRRARFATQITGVAAKPRLQVAELCRFDGLVDVDRYSRVDYCQIAAGMTVASASADIQPSGMTNTNFAGTFTGPVGSLRLDGNTNYWFKTNAAVLAGGATKVMHDDLVP